MVEVGGIWVGEGVDGSSMSLRRWILFFIFIIDRSGVGWGEG